MATFQRFRQSGFRRGGGHLALGGNMATQPGGGVVARSSAAPPKKSFFWSCFSCRMLAGSGVVAAGLWVHMGARQSLRQRRPGSAFDIFRLVFAFGLYSWAIVIILDPVQPK